MARKRTKPDKIRLTEVAKLAGVSPITASRFFRNPEALSIGKRVRVESAAKELGYVPNLAARALASQRTEVIGVLIPSLTNNVFSDVLRGIYDALDGSRYSIQLANTRYSILQEERLLRLFLAQKPVAAYLNVPSPWIVGLLAIGIGGGIGWFMLLNVWGIVWRMQKKLIRWTAASAAEGTPLPPEAAKLAQLTQLAAQTNFILSFPLLLMMAVASHYPISRS